MWDFSSHLNALAESENDVNRGASIVSNQAPLAKFMHKDEGYAIDWNPLVPGRLVSGTDIIFLTYWLMILSGYLELSQCH